jgi:hypothetical protein
MHVSVCQWIDLITPLSVKKCVIELKVGHTIESWRDDPYWSFSFCSILAVVSDEEMNMDACMGGGRSVPFSTSSLALRPSTLLAGLALKKHHLSLELANQCSFASRT